ncbi:MAG: ATP-binding cassette domain-containing protein, partial [Proteobacteria bacterium]|nr:ATP-binding cassette domain-containing protein [Pseudomonadota bacterium]
VVDALLVVGSLAMLFIYDFLLSTVVVGTTLIVLCVRAGLYPQQRRALEQRIVVQAEEQTAFLEVVRGISSIRAQGLEGQRLSQWQRLNARWVNKDMKLARLNIAAQAVETLAYGCQLLLVIYLGAHAVLDQRMSVGMLYAILTYRGHFSMHTAGLIDQVINLATLRVHLDRLADILLSDPEQRGKLIAGFAELKTITLQDVSFRYADNEPWLFRQLSLSIAPGEFVALIGSSGSGKSSLLKVICGALQPVEGMVRVDDRSITSPDWRRGYRKASGIVMQNDTLFAGSIAHNVCAGADVDHKRVHTVLARCGLAAVVSRLPMGIETLIGDTAANLSAGQIQRLLLSRALYRQPVFLFMDEVTANLDVQTAMLVQELIAGEQVTRVLVTHDITLASRADRVLVIDEGKVVELSQDQLAMMKHERELKFEHLDVEVA